MHEAAEQTQAAHTWVEGRDVALHINLTLTDARANVREQHLASGGGNSLDVAGRL